MHILGLPQTPHTSQSQERLRQVRKYVLSVAWGLRLLSIQGTHMLVLLVLYRPDSSSHATHQHHALASCKSLVGMFGEQGSEHDAQDALQMSRRFRGCGSQ